MSDFIHVYENVISKKTCEVLVDAVDGAAADGTHALRLGYRNCDILSFQEGMAHFDEVRAAIHASFRRYIDEAGGRVLNFCSLLEEPNIVRYSPGIVDHFDEHADCWSSESVTRQVSVILYLNDVTDGGETVFPRFNVWVKPRRGSILLFPSAFTHMHRGDPSRSEPKRCIVTWIHMGTPQANNVHYKTVALRP